MEITDEQWSQMVKRLDGVEQSIFDDRKDIDRILIEMTTIKEQNNKILNMQVRGQEKVTEVVQKAVSEAIEPTNDMMQTITDKTQIKLDEYQAKKLLEKKSFWKTVKSWKFPLWHS